MTQSRLRRPQVLIQSESRVLSPAVNRQKLSRYRILSKLRLSLNLKEILVPIPDDDITQADANRLCFAASCIFFALLRRQAIELGNHIALPELLCPKRPLPPPSELDAHLAEEATAMLIRLGVVEIQKNGEVKLILVGPI